MNVSREIYDKLQLYKKLVEKWSATINLVSSNDIGHLWERHIVDSLQLMKYLVCSDEIIDIGSGAGFPAIVLSIAGIEKISLIDSDRKRVSFLNQAKKISDNNVEIINKYWEKTNVAECDVITARACCSIVKLLSITRGVKIRKKFLLHKGEKYLSEIDEAKKLWLFDYTINDSITREASKIIEIYNLKPK
jgi:16S rRNA (guanine527-N7)-methyltransferase